MRYARGKAGQPGMEKKDGGRRYAAAVAALAATAGLAVIAAPAGAATKQSTPATPGNSFAQTNLIASKVSLGAKLTDKDLTNAWGLAAGSSTPIWVSDSGSGLATAYTGGVNKRAVSRDLTVKVPGGNPTGQVFVPAGTDFDVTANTHLDLNTAKPVSDKQYPAEFIVDTDSIGTKPSGEIADWTGGSSFVVEDSPTGGAGGKTPAGAIFKGLALATTANGGPELFAADVHNARVDVFNNKFQPLKTQNEFRDPKIPVGYAPFGIQNLNGRIYVTYGKQNQAKTDVVPGAGLGFIDVYTINGELIKHLVAHGPLNAPWGLALAPKGFGPFGGDLLAGNLGNGWINAFSPTTGKYLGPLKSATGHPIAISGLWGLRFGNGTFGGSSSLVFSAGPSTYQGGLVGVLN
ncbi:MAG: TIGR03118 family protein, partial [Trebonia sp.]